MDLYEGFIEQLSEKEAVVVRLDRSKFTVARHTLPDQIRVGDFVIRTDHGTYRIDAERTEKRRQEIRRMADSCMQ